MTSTLDLHTPDSLFEAAMLAAVLALAFVLLSGAFGRSNAAMITFLDFIAFTITGNIAIALATASVGGIMIVAGTSRDRRTDGDAFVPLAREVVVLLGGLALYTFGRTLVESGAASAYDNTARIIDIEHSLGLFVEPDLQRWVLNSEPAIRAFNWMYSFGFLAVMAGALLWLWANDRASYRHFRNSLGISALLAIAIIAIFPAAPPRLTSSSGVIDSVVFFGRDHTFVNEYAAMPSLHVGWLAAAAYVLGRRLRGPTGIFVMVVPTALMLLTVVVTGNHFWLDGMIGAIITVGPAIALSHGEAVASRSAGFARSLGLTQQGLARIAFSATGLGGLLAYMLIAQWLTPGFTNFWGYLTVQVSVLLVFAVGGEIAFAREGGLSWITHILMVVCTFADVFGTDGNLYASIDEYDKLTHFLGVAAATAALYDVLRALNKRRVIEWAPADRFVAAVVFGVILGIAWEVYEYLGDVVFHTARVNSRLDTINDLVFDTMGALLVGLLMLRAEQNAPEDEIITPTPSLLEVSATEDEGVLTRA